jgi:hypothetical protein
LTKQPTNKKRTHRLGCTNESERLHKRPYGVDNSSLIPEEGLKPFPNSIIYKDVYRLEKRVSKIKQIDIVVAVELITVAI